VLFVAIFLVLNFVLNSDDPQGVAARPNANGKNSTPKSSTPTTNEAASGTGGDAAKDGKTPHALRGHPESATKSGDHYYEAFLDRLTWDEARQRCQAKGGYLVCIESSAEARRVFKLARGQYVWLGGYKKDGKWRWVNGSLIEYTNWAPDEPNNYNRLEDRLVLDMNGSWNDTRSSEAYVSGFICEWEF
jgi:hypothetical protein